MSPTPKTVLSLALGALLAAAPPLLAAGKPAPRKDAGTVTLGTEVYRFKPGTLSASASKPMALYLRGQLVPVKGGKTLAFSFQLFRPGPLGGMELGPRTGNGTTWIATTQSKVDAAYAEPLKEGAEAVFTFSGPLLRSEGGKSLPTTWQGRITAPFTSVP